MRRFSDAEKLKAIEREVRLRRQRFPNLVATGRMSVEESIYQTMIMESIAEDYREKADLPL